MRISDWSSDVCSSDLYETYITYDVYVVPGLIGLIQLFNGMQNSLSMVYDREMGSMRVLLATPLPRGFLLFARMLSGTAVSIIQVYAFIAKIGRASCRERVCQYV